MSRAAQNFRETDVAKAMRASLKAGITVQRYEIERGKITIVPAAVTETADEDERVAG